MNTNSNSYTILYASIMVVVVAFLLAFVSDVLRPTQEQNVELDKKKQILAALNIRDLDSSDAVAAKYQEVVVADMVVKSDGTVVKSGKEKDQDGFKVENKNINDNNLPVYLCKVNGQTKYVIPMSGRGLWGGLWGYMAVNDDFKTIFGAYFSHESETAGLGSPIAGKEFQERFQEKQIFADSSATQVALTVVKKGQVKNPQYEVDGLTGATLTTKGAAAMINGGLQQYIKFFSAYKNNAGK